MIKRYLILTIGLILASGALPAQTHMRQRLDSLFNDLSSGNKSMGSICISRNGQVLYSRAIGYSVIDGAQSTPAAESSKYRVASITKMFTAALIFHMVQEGKLDFTTTLENYFPQLPGANTITIGMMLGHRSGLHNIFDDPDFTTWKTAARSEEEVVKMIAAFPLDFTPDAKAAYSNSNYILLGYIAEKVYGKPYAELVKERIISKAGLSNTYYGAATDLSKGECYSYVYDNAWTRQPEADMSILGGAGALISTPTDLVRFIEDVYSHKLIKPRHLNRMQEIKDGFGMGMFAYELGTHKGYGHPGSIDGFSSLLEYFPEDRLAICYCSNGTVAPVTDIVNTALNIVFESDKEE